MRRADLEQFQNKCPDRATIKTVGDFVELSIDVDAYRVMVGFDRQSSVVTSSSVEIRPVLSTVPAPEPEDDGSDHEPEVSQWEAAGTFIGKAISLGKAVASKAIEGPVSGAKLDFRVQCCFGETMGGERINEPCPEMVTKGGNNYCRSCGCGTKGKLARLNPQIPGEWNTSKLAYPYLNCPLNRFGPVNGSRRDG